MLSPSADAINYADTARALFINLVSISIFALAIYFRRHRRKDLAMVFWFFNVCLFVTVAVIQMTEVAAALGFGLFAILSIIRLRSEPFSNRELGYFFGALVLGLVNGIGTGSTSFTLWVNGLLLVSMFVLDHPLTLRSVERRHVIFDRVVTDENELRRVLSDRLGGAITDVTVIAIDFVRDSMELEVTLTSAQRHSTYAQLPAPTIS